jgi:signal transduction histidine kinase
MAFARRDDVKGFRHLGGRFHSQVEKLLRSWPIRWRIFLIALVNAFVVVALAALVWTGTKILSEAWADLSRVRQSDWALVALESEAGRLQLLLQRYFSRPDPSVMAEITQRREALATSFAARVAADPALTDAVASLKRITEQSLADFEKLRAAQAATVKTYETEVSKPAREMTGLYAIIDGATRNQGNLIWPSLGKSREAFSAILVAVNAYYLAPTSDVAEEARRNIAVIERTIPVMRDLADSDLQLGALKRLQERAVTLRTGLDALADAFATQSRPMRELVEGNGRAMSGAIDTLSLQLHDREARSHARFDAELAAVYSRISLVVLASLIIIVGLGMAVARTISGPLNEVIRGMKAIVSGDYDRDVSGLDAGDEIGAMARSLEVFRGDAIARHRAEADLRSAKDSAEVALASLRDAQTSLIEAEKLAALGGLVAGVAHEVNTPIGMSLTVASSFAQRCEVFALEFESGTLRRSRVADFIGGGREAARQLVANLHRAGELIQSFKQVAVDRSHADRRLFDLREATEQIMSSLRPGLKKRQLRLNLSVPDGIVMDSFPGSYGQVLTNLFVNATTHAFPGDGSGTLRVEARLLKPDLAEIVFADDGRGMSDEVQRRAFDPFFTTLRGRGGTGLGLHIVQNIVTRQLGGRIAITSRPGAGTTFRITLPLIAKSEALVEPLRVGKIASGVA